MTESGSACGSYSDNTCNLPEENYEAFADYFITITKYFIDKGVPVKYISPINEPQWSWGGGWVGQEGCHYEPEQALAVFKVFAEKIKESGLPVKLMAPESGEIGETTENYSMPFTMMQKSEKFSVHLLTTATGVTVTTGASSVSVKKLLKSIPT